MREAVFVPGHYSLTSLSECELNSSSKSRMAGFDFRAVYNFVNRTLSARSTALTVLGLPSVRIVHTSVRDLMASVRKDWFGHPFHLLNGSPLPFVLSFGLFVGAAHLISVLRLTAVSAFAHGLWLAVLAAIILT